MRTSASRHPILFSIVTVAVFLIALWLPAIFLSYLGPSFFRSNGDFLFQCVVECYTALIGIGLVFIMGYGNIFGERGKGLLSGVGVSAYFIVLCLYSLVVSAVSILFMTDVQLNPTWLIVVFAIMVFLVGLAEETFFRGVVANLFFDKYGSDPAGVWSAVICSGLVFGLMHLQNALGSGLTGVMVQVVSAIAMGMAFTAIYYRVRNIWVLILLHGFYDFCGAFTYGFLANGSLSDAISSYQPIQCISAIPYVIVVAVLIRPSKMKEIICLRDCTEDELPAKVKMLPDKFKSAPKSKLRCALSVIIAVVVVVGLVGACFMDLNYEPSITYENRADWDGSEYFSVTAAKFTTAYSDDYTITIYNYPSSNDAKMTVTVTDSQDEVVYSETFSGRTSAVRTVAMVAKESYTIVLDYDYSEVGELAEGEREYVTSIKVEY